MISITLSIKPYLAQYMYVRYEQYLTSRASGVSPQQLVPIKLSHSMPVYQLLYHLTVARPNNVPLKEMGNISFMLPAPRNGKSPQTYNYIGHASLLAIQREIETEMRTELYEYLLKNKFTKGIMFKKSMHQFVERYGMEETVEEETLMRAFQRWRKQVKAENKLGLF